MDVDAHMMVLVRKLFTFRVKVSPYAKSTTWSTAVIGVYVLCSRG